MWKRYQVILPSDSFKFLWWKFFRQTHSNFYNERLVNMMNPSFSFLGLVKLTRMDSSKGWTYMKSIWYPLQSCVKIHRYSLKIVLGGGLMKMKHPLYRQHVALEHDTRMFLMSGLGYPHLVTCLSEFGWSILPLIWLFHFVVITLSPMLNSNAATL